MTAWTRGLSRLRSSTKRGTPARGRATEVSTAISPLDGGAVGQQGGQADRAGTVQDGERRRRPAGDARRIDGNHRVPARLADLEEVADRGGALRPAGIGQRGAQIERVPILQDIAIDLRGSAAGL